MVDIIPAILAHSYSELEESLAKLRGVVRHVQVDIVDGTFAHGKTWPYHDGAHFAQIVEQERGLPFWDELDFEFDLMVADPAAVAHDYVHAGASRIIVHAASPSALGAVQSLVDLRDDGGAMGVAVGVAIGCADNPEVLEPFEAQFDFVQVMGIERIGLQGQPLAQQALYLIERLRHRYASLPIQVGGGVKLEQVKRLVAAGATRLVCGSAIMAADDPAAAYKALYTEANAQ